MLDAIDRGDADGAARRARRPAPPGRLPRRDRRRARPLHGSPTSRAPSPTSWCAAIRTSSATSQVRDADEVVRNWQRIKAEERRARRPRRDAASLDGVPARCPPSPARSRSARSSRTSASTGPTSRGVLAKVDEERRELERRHRRAATAPAARASSAICCSRSTSLARHLEVQAEMALRDATSRLRRPCRARRGGARAAGRAARTQLDDGERDRLWEAAKAAGPLTVRRFDPSGGRVVTALPRGESCVGAEAPSSDREAHARATRRCARGSGTSCAPCAGRRRHGRSAAAETASRDATRALDKAVTKGLIHRNNASRRIVAPVARGQPAQDRRGAQ